MPAKPGRRWRSVPSWVHDLGDDCLAEILGDAFVAKDFAEEDFAKVERRGKSLPKGARVAFETAEDILADIRSGRIAAAYRCKQASVAVRRFGEARTAARVAIGDVGFVSGRDRRRRRAGRRR